MKKHLIAAAVAATLAVPAMAQVKISGTLDIGVMENRDATAKVSGSGAVSAKVKTSNTGEDSGYSTSVLNFSGSEDLGGGLKAGFFWNQTINPDSGAEGAREGYLTLDGGFGQVKVGRFVPAGEKTIGSSITGTTLQPGTIDPLFNWDGTELGRQGGNIQYTTPSIAGFKVIVGYNDQTSDASATAGKVETRQIDLAVAYSAGPLKVGVSKTTGDYKAEAGAANGLALAGSKADIDMTGLSVSYNMGPALLKAGYFDYKSKRPGSTVSDIDGYQAGVTVPLGAISLYAGIYDAKDKDDGTAANKIDLEGHQLGAIYSLSKRTSAYVVMGQDKLKTVSASGKIKGTVLGIRHSF
jgi:general bacterial porin, GBP family